MFIALLNQNLWNKTSSCLTFYKFVISKKRCWSNVLLLCLRDKFISIFRLFMSRTAKGWVCKRRAGSSYVSSSNLRARLLSVSYRQPFLSSVLILSSWHGVRFLLYLVLITNCNMLLCHTFLNILLSTRKTMRQPFLPRFYGLLITILLYTCNNIVVSVSNLSNVYKYKKFTTCGLL